MDEDNTSPNLFKIVFNRMVITIKEIFKGQQNFTTVDNFNKNCTDDMDCEDLSLFCNLTAKKCQCTNFYSRNENASICEFQQANLTSWIRNNATKEEYVHQISTNLSVHWTIPATIILGIFCLFMCAIYACLEDKDNENPLVSEVLYTKQEHSCQIKQIPIKNSVCELQNQSVERSK